MAQLSTRSLATIEAAARRAARQLAGAVVPAIVGIDVQVSDRGAILGVSVGSNVGPDYKLYDLEPGTIRGAILDALDHATHGPRNWRRL